MTPLNLLTWPELPPSISSPGQQNFRDPGSQNAIFEFQEFEMQFLEANFFFVGAIKMK